MHPSKMRGGSFFRCLIITSKLKHTSINGRKHESILKFIQAEMEIVMVKQACYRKES
jgi:hypothetical protein